MLEVLERHAAHQKQPEKCIMEFMALAGEKDPDRPGEWTVTLLMCLQRMAKKGTFWARERLQVADCEIKQQQWLVLCSEITEEVRLV